MSIRATHPQPLAAQWQLKIVGSFAELDCRACGQGVTTEWPMSSTPCAGMVPLRRSTAAAEGLLCLPVVLV